MTQPTPEEVAETINNIIRRSIESIQTSMKNGEEISYASANLVCTFAQQQLTKMEETGMKNVPYADGTPSREWEIESNYPQTSGNAVRLDKEETMSKEKMSDELLPCPFCGGKPDLNSGDEASYICCEKCGCCSIIDFEDKTIKAWNTRAPHTDTALAEVIASQKQTQDALIKKLSNETALADELAGALREIAIEYDGLIAGNKATKALQRYKKARGK